MKAELNIKEAIRYFNDNRKPGTPELTSAGLGLKVLANNKSSDESKIVLFYQIINNRRRFVDLEWLVKIAQITGYPADKLIKYN